MKAYLIAVETVHDEAMFAEYRKEVVDTVKSFGGQFIARGGKALAPLLPAERDRDAHDHSTARRSRLCRQ